MKSERDTSETASFLERWSRRKRGAETGDQVDDVGDATATPQASPEAGGEAEADVRETRDFSDFDFEKLDYESDYEQFMGDDVTPDVRHKALRKLWVSNPVLANMDGLDDYCEDYTDAAVCLPKGMLKTAYRYGRGFLSDEEVAEWEALGRPEPSPEAEPAAVAAADDPAAPSSDGTVVAAVSDAQPESVESSGPGAACAAAVKAEDAEMLAEFEAATEPPAAPAPRRDS